MFKPKRTIFIILVVTLTIIAPPVRAQQTSKQAEHKAMVSKAGLDPERLARIPVRMQELVDKGMIAGAVMLVARHGQVALLEAVGYQDLETKTPMRTDALFQIRSMGKSIQAVGIMILLEEGRLTLNDPVEKYLPEFRDQKMVDQQDGDKVVTTKKPSRPITIYDLLTHTSGMPGVPYREPFKGWIQEFDRKHKSLSEGFPILAQQPLEFEPGTKFLYSDPGFATLGRIIEVASGQPEEDFKKQRIFRPLGMKNTFIFAPPEKYGRMASIYKLENGTLKKSSQGGGARVSTASDMFAFYQMMLNGGTYNGVRILSRASVEAMTKLHTGHLGQGYGLGWSVGREPNDVPPLQSIGSYGHGGRLGTLGLVDPKKDLVTVFMIQRDGLGRYETQGIFMAMVAAAIADDLKSTTKVTKTGTKPK